MAALGTETPFTPPARDIHARTALGLFVHQAIAMLIESGAIRILGSLLVEEQREPGLLGVFREPNSRPSPRDGRGDAADGSRAR